LDKPICDWGGGVEISPKTGTVTKSNSPHNCDKDLYITAFTYRYKYIQLIKFVRKMFLASHGLDLEIFTRIMNRAKNIHIMQH
jgi:hypothetical protein